MFGGWSIRGLGLGVIVGAAALAACGSKREEGSPSRATASTAPAPLPSAALARAEGSVLAPSAQGFANKAKGRAALAAVVPGQANQATRLAANGVHVELQAEGAADRAGELGSGTVIYRDAFTDTDVVLAAQGARFEELRVLRSAKAPAEARYRIRTNGKLRASGGTLVVVDASGRARLRTLPAFAVDATGKKRAVEVRLDTSGSEPVLVAKLDTAGLTYPVTVDPTWVSGDWPSEAVVALNSVWLKEHSTLTSTVNGAVAVIDASPGPVLAGDEEAVVGQNVTVTGTVSANRVRIKLGGVVNGEVRENSLINNGTINGATVTPLALPLPITAPAFPTFSAGTTAVTLAQHEDRTLAPGDYGQVTLQMGSVADPTVLSLSGGIYNLDGLNVGEKSRVECAAACEIRIKNRLEPGEDSFIGPAAGSGLTPADVEIFVEGINGSSGALGGTPKAATIGFDNSVQARIYAANGTLWIKSGTTATGTFVARDVLVGEGVSVTKDATGTCGPLSDNNPCTADSCDEGTGTVHHDPLPAGTSCANADVCDGSETCDGAGSCQAGTPPQIDDGNPCTADACSPSTGVTHAPVAAGTACGDGNACNGDETCNASGSCQAGTPPSIDDGNACTADSCDPQTGISHALLTGTTCNDSDACTQTDTCQAGTCTGSNPVVCSASDQCHDAGTCNPSTGVCSNPPKANGSACNDANSCTQTDTCQAGSCSGANPVVCTASDQCHTAGTCDPGSGACSNPAKADGSTCNDGDACTQTDSCQAGTCTGSNPIVCTASDQCHDPGICDSGTGVCSNPAKPDGSSCDDANACTQSDSCQAGSCTGSNPVVCTALDQCHLPGTCSPSTGTCSNPPKPNGSACDDSSACTSGETCTAGSCGGGTPVATDDGNPCTADACDPQAGVSHTPVAAGTSCADANVCNGAEACDGSGACQPGTPLAVDDGNACTADACDPQTGVSHTPLAAGTSCADATLCNGDETCDGSGNCTAGAPPNLDDANVCTDDACDPQLGVTHTPVAAGTSCADATVCNGAESCDGFGICQAGTPLQVDDGNACTTDACDPSTGVSHTSIPGCDPAPTAPGARFETRASLLGRLVRESGTAVTGYTLTVHDAPATGAPRADVQLVLAADGSFRARLTTFPDSVPRRTPAHKVIVGITGPGFAPINRVAYLYPGDAVNLGEITVLDLDPQVTMIGPAGGVATDSQGLVELTFPPGAVSTTIPVQVTPIQARKKFPFPLPDSTATGYGVALSPHAQEFAVPVTMRMLNYRNVPTNLTLPVGTVEYVNGGWDHIGLATWDGQRFRTTITHFSAVDANPGTPGELAWRLHNGLDGDKSNAGACGASTLSYAAGSVRQQIRLPGTSRRGEEYGFTLHYDSGLAGSRKLGTAPSTPFQAAGDDGLAIPIVGPSIETICVPPGSSAPSGFCSSGGGGGGCLLGISPAVDLAWTQYVAGIEAKKSTDPTTTTVGIGSGTYINLPPNADGTLPNPSHMVSEFVSAFAGTNGGGGTCTADGGGFGSGASTSSSQITSLEPGPQVRHKSYVLAYHRRTSAFGAGWGLEQAREAFLTPTEDQLDLVHGDGRKETFRSRTTATLASTSLGLGEKAMARDRLTGEVFFTLGSTSIVRLNADGTSTTVLSSLALPGSPAALAVAYVAGQRRFAVACQNGLAMVDAGGVVTTVAPRTGPFQPSPGVAAVGSVVFYTDAIGSLIHKYDFADPTLTDDPIGDPSGDLSLDPKQPASGVAFDRPEGLAIGSQSELYVACPRRHTVYMLAPDASGLPSDASAVARVLGRGSGSMIAPVGVDSPGQAFTMGEPFALDVADDGTLYALSYAGLAKYDPVSKNARWFALHGEFGLSLRHNRSFVATSPSEVVVTVRFGSQAYALRDLGLTSEYDPTRTAHPNAAGLTVTDTTADTIETYAFDDASRATGRLTELRKRTGELVYQLAWVQGPQQLQLDYLEDASGGKHQFAYTAQGKLLRITDPSGRQMQFNVDAAGDLTGITLPSGEAHHFDYQFHRMSAKRDPRGEQTNYTYRQNGTADTATRPGGGQLTMVAALSKDDKWDANGRPVYEATFTDDRGVEHTVTINAAGRVERDAYTADGVAYDVQNVYQQLLGVLPSMGTDGTERPNDLFRVSHTKVNGLTVTPITSYDVFGRPIQQDLPLNSLTSGQTIGETAGRFWEFTWGGDQRPSQVRPVGTNIFWPIERDPTGRVSRVHDERNSGFGPTGRESLFTWRPDGQPQTTTQHGVTTTFGYHPTTANLTSTSDTLGRTLAMTYSAAGNVQTVNDGTTTITFGHDNDNRLTTITDALGHVTTMGYAHAGCACAYGDRVTSLHTPDLAANQKWSFTYDPDGQLASVTDPLGKTEAYTYNASRDLIGFTDRKNRTTTFTYDQLGRPASTQDPALRKGTFAYPVPVSGNWTGAAVFAGSPDATPAPTSLTASLRDGEYQIGLREHRAGGNPAQVEFYRDATFELSFGRSFDAFGRLLRREDRVGLPFASGNVFGTPSFFDHDLNYELNTPLPILASYATSRPGGAMDSTFTNNFEFDTTASQGLFGPQPYTQESYTRDAAGRITGISTTFRVSSNIYTHQALGVVYQPTNKRQVQQLTSGSGVQDFTYDTRGLVATRTVTIPRPRWVNVGNSVVLIDEPYLLGTFTYEYDEVGRNTVLTYPPGHTRTQVWDELGRLTSRCYDYTTTIDYPGAGPTRCYTAQYDEVGNPTLLTDPERSCTIGYDALDRVTSVTCSDGHSESYDYNAIGALSVNAGAVVDHQRPRLSGGGNASGGLPATIAGQAVVLDAVGRVTSLNGQTLTWNRLGRLETIGAYDSFLRWISGDGLYLYEGPNIAAIADGDLTHVNRRFGYDGVDHPLWIFDNEPGGGFVHWYELDVIGNVRRLRNGPDTSSGSGNPTDFGGYKYTAFGKLLPPDAGTPYPGFNTAFEQPLRWQGRWYIDIAGGIYDFRNRQWSPELGAFLSPDRFQFATRSSTLWGWPGQNPLGNRDPFGLKDWSQSEVKQMMDDYAVQLKSSRVPAWTMLNEHQGRLDFFGREETRGDTFDVPGQGVLDSAEMGNFIAGYAAGIENRDPYIILLVRLAGGFFGSVAARRGEAPPGELRYLGDNESSVSQIQAGYDAGFEKFYGVCK